jgi:hypothetical protein
MGALSSKSEVALEFADVACHANTVNIRVFDLVSNGAALRECVGPKAIGTQVTRSVDPRSARGAFGALRVVGGRLIATVALLASCPSFLFVPPTVANNAVCCALE